MDNRDIKLVEEAEAIEDGLWSSVMAELPEDGQRRLTLSQSLMLTRMLVEGRLRPGPAFDLAEARQSLREMMRMPVA